jgi:hypothetical protein
VAYISPAFTARLAGRFIVPCQPTLVDKPSNASAGCMRPSTTHQPTGKAFAKLESAIQFAEENLV